MQPVEYLTAAEVAAILRTSVDTVIRRFENRPGVIDLGSSERRFRRRYRVLRIPREALESFIRESEVAPRCRRPVRRAGPDAASPRARSAFRSS